MKKIKVAVIGVGYLGKFHAEKYSRMANVDLIGVVDSDPERAMAIAEQFRTTPYFSHQDIIGKVDAVSIAVPTPDHFAVCRDFLEANIDVLIEKPITDCLDEADHLVDLARHRGRVLQVGHLERFNPAVVALKDIISRPMFIESHRLSIYKPRCIDVSVILDLMIHDIDLILGFVRSEIRDIHASGIPVISGHIDIASVRLEFDNGCVANVTASRISLKNERKLRLFQKDAYVSIDFASRDILVIRRNGSQTEGIIPGTDIRQWALDKGDALESELTAFIHSVSQRQPPEVTGQMGRDALKISLLIMDRIHSFNQSHPEALSE
jgi:predicted dehydrogenase